MNIVAFAKSHLTRLPLSAGSKISLIPYKYRLGIGSIYRKRTNEIKNFDVMSNDQRKEFIFDRVRHIACFAYKRTKFYESFYSQKNFDPNDLHDFDDLAGIPSLTKADLLKVDISERSVAGHGGELVNTGGSSGATLDFSILPSSVAHEWAHMHKIWDVLDFRQNNLKIVFAGRSSNVEVLQYDSARHHISVNIYCEWSEIAGEMVLLYRRVQPKYLHGYPSAIFDFVIWLKESDHQLLHVLKEHVTGLFLGSEFPSPSLRAEVEMLLDCRSVSWYGHTERCVLAYERDEAGCYQPFQTYGYCEAVGEKGAEQLVGTSYYNFASPLIRYNTEDIVAASSSASILQSFKVTGGRTGEFIHDINGNKIFLTALIFGRHHAIFDIVSQIQVQQVHNGIARIFVVPRDVSQSTHELDSLFDGTNVLVTFSFHILRKPFVSSSGKVPLLVPSHVPMEF